MAIVFPASPSVNETFTAGSITYKWDGDKWIGLGVTPADRLIEGSNSLEINASNQLVWTGDDIIQSSANKSFKSNSTSSGDYVRMYAGGGTAQWDIYGNGELLRMGDNSSSATARVQFDNPTFHRSTATTTGVAALTAKQEVNNGGYLIYEGLNSSDTSVFSVTHNGRVKIAENLGIGSSTDPTAGPLCIDIANGQGAGAGAACGIFLRNTQATNNNAVTIFGGADDYSNAASAINFINSNHANNYGDISFDTRGISLYGTGYTERMRLYSSGALRFANAYVANASTSGIDNAHAYFDANPTLLTWGSSGAKDTYFQPSLVVRTPVRDGVNNPAIVISEKGGQATGRNSLVFFNNDYDNNLGFIKARLYTQVGSGYTDPSFYIDVADNTATKTPQQRFSINSNGTFSGSSSNNISDARLKENVQTIENPIDKIRGLTGRTFTWTDASTRNDGKIHYGFIAQEVDTVVSDLVNHDSGLTWFDADDNIVGEFDENVANSSKTVHENGVIPILVEALKEALDKIDTLEARLQAGGL